MPYRRPRPLNLKPAPKRKARPSPKSPRRPRAPGRDSGSPAVLYAIAAGLVVTLAGIIVLYLEAPEIKAWLARERAPAPSESIASAPAPESAPAEEPAPPPKPVPAAPPPMSEEKRIEALKKKANAETEKLITQAPPQAAPAPHAANPTIR